MIFDRLPILSGGGTKMAGPHMYDIYIDSTERVLRLEGAGIITFWGVWSSSFYYARPIYEGSIATCTLEIDGTTYDHRNAASSSDLITGGYMDAATQENTGGSTSATVIPTEYIFYEYLEITIKKKSSGNSNFCIQYYDLDADNPVTVTYA